ncbi:hypothetical protein Tco_1398735, partial [Tanacetum coccineum]
MSSSTIAPSPTADTTGTDSGKETVTTVTIPNSSEPTTVDALTAQASPPLVCIFRFVGDSAAGAAMGSVFGY